MILLIVTVQCSDNINSNSVVILLIVLLIVTVQCSDTINSNSVVILLIVPV